MPAPVFSSLHQIALGVQDIDRASRFYREVLAAEHVATFDPPGLAFFLLGEVRLLLERTVDPKPGCTVLYLRVGDIHETCTLLKERGVQFDSEPHLIHRDETGVFGTRGSEEWMAFFRDPDENALALASTVHGSSAA